MRKVPQTVCLPRSSAAQIAVVAWLPGSTGFRADRPLQAQAFGGPLGGWLGDVAARKFPNHGRIVICQFSVASGVPFTILVLKVRRASDRTNRERTVHLAGHLTSPVPSTSLPCKSHCLILTNQPPLGAQVPSPPHC